LFVYAKGYEYMKVLLVGVNARFTHSNLALYYLRNEIVQYDHYVVIEEYSINQDRIDVIESICLQQPEVILFSVYIWNSLFMQGILPEIRILLPESRIIIGGPEAGYNASFWVTSISGIDAVIFGAGEKAVRLLAQNNFNCTAVFNMKENESRQEKVLLLPNTSFSNIPIPYIENDFVRFENRYMYYESSRGCTFACTYCLSSRDDQKYEIKSSEQTIAELSYILKHKPMTLKFVDRSFNAHPIRAREIWKFCAQHTAYTNFHFEIHPLFLEAEDYAILKDIPDKAFRFEIGIQSVNEESLNAISRKVLWEAISPKIQKLIELNNINIHCDLIAGLPFETMKEIAVSFNEILSLKPHHLQLGFLKVLPGTIMYEKASEYGMLTLHEPPYQVLQTKWLSHKEMATVRRIENVVESVYNGGLNYLMEELSSYGDMFTLYKKCTDFCVKSDFNLSTRNAAKTKMMLAKFKEYLTQ
jgi:radical SAM superfamily enzyme YgiQ (UPF0313 family)